MGLKCGIIGLTNSGKTTLFNCISNTKAQATNFAYSTNKSNMGICNVPDPRLIDIHRFIKAEKLIFTTVDIVDIPGLAKGASEGLGLGNTFLADIRQVDALVQVLRCFEDANLPHVEGSIDPVRDIDIVEFELQIKDLEQIEKKLQKVEKSAKVGDKDAKKAAEILLRCKAHIENFNSIRTLEISEDEHKHIADLMLLTEKPVMYVCNVDEDSAVDGNQYSNAVVTAMAQSGAEIVVVAGKLEADIAELDSEEDRSAFLQDVGLSEPSVNKLINTAYRLLNLISFFTVGGKENRAWSICKGATAPQAAGAIHSDLERGFIRAEVIKYIDLVQFGSEQKCKESGKMSVEGKNYIIHDGDILNIRFNV
ncbi:MAG: redox-regulated ATPase YchF [Bacteroidota bacterium]